MKPLFVCYQYYLSEAEKAISYKELLMLVVAFLFLFICIITDILGNWKVTECIEFLQGE